MKIVITSVFVLAVFFKMHGQDLNAVTGSGFNIATGFTPTNAPQVTVISGMQMEYDGNYKFQLVHAYNSDNFYLRSYRNGNSPAWTPYYKVWHANNLNNSTANFLANTINASAVDVNGNIVLRNNANASHAGASLNFTSYAADPGPSIKSDLHIANGVSSSSALVLSSYVSGYRNELTIHNGRIGINTSAMDEALTVKGKIHTSEVRVDLQPNVAPDYVFEKDYNLIPLSEVESYINTNKHLPEVPSAKEMETEGMNLKEMNLILLKKVEELTLYLLAERADKNKLRIEVDELKKQVEIISQKIK